MKTGFTKAAPFVCSLLACLQTVKGWSEPAFCHSCECPEFRVEQINEEINYEKRYYEGSRWLRIKIPDLEFKNLQHAFYMLNGYFNRDNEKSRKFAETKPAAVTILNTKEGEKYFVSFYVPPNTDLPKPKNQSITEEYIPAGRMYVRVFGGTPTVQNWLSHLAGLKADLTSAGETYSHNRSMALGYDSMLTFFNRHDEVWIPAA